MTPPALPQNPLPTINHSIPRCSSIHIESGLLNDRTAAACSASASSSPPACNGILQQLVSLDIGGSFCPSSENSKLEASAGRMEISATKVEKSCLDACVNLDSSHGLNREQLKKAHACCCCVMERREKIGAGNSPHCKAHRKYNTDRTKKSVCNRRPAITVVNAESRLPKIVDGRHEQRRHAQASSEGNLQGRHTLRKRRRQLASDFRAKSKAKHRNFRKSRRRRLRKSPAMRSRRKLPELLYTGLVTPSRRLQKWEVQPSAYCVTAAGTLNGDVNELDISELPRSGCRSPWSWSTVQGKTRSSVMKVAEIAMPCGISDSLAKNAGRTLFEDSSTSSESFSVTSNISETSFNTDSDSRTLPGSNPPFLEHSTDHSDSVACTARMPEESNDISSMKPAYRPDVTVDSSSEAVANLQHSLNQKYMPKSFNDIVGQNLVTQSLCNALSRRRIAPMYIFYGPQGTGKTSCAKIFAAALNCISSERPRPCGACTECASGNSSKFKEYNIGGKNGIKLLMHDVIWSSSAHYSVYVVNECHTLTHQSWDAFMKVVDEAPRNTVFILSASRLEHIPHEVASRCQKFHFSKIKETEVVCKLQSIAEQEGMEVEMEALKLIASICDGSLRDAEMILDQLSLLGQKISVSIVQELMGLIPDDKLLDLLDFALSADTVNTVRNLKELMLAGTEPLSLISQLACLITSILAGGFQIPTQVQRENFFRQELTKEDLERLRQALKTLSEADKQLRDSSDQTTLLTAALLQFAPEVSYSVPRSSYNIAQPPEMPGTTDKTPNTNSYSKKRPRPYVSSPNPTYFQPRLGSTTECASNNDVSDTSRFSVTASSQAHTMPPNQPTRGVYSPPEGRFQVSGTKTDNPGKTWIQMTTSINQLGLEDIWQQCLDAIHSSSLRKFLMTEGKLAFFSMSNGFAVAHLEFSQAPHAFRAIRSRTSIAYAFHCTLGYPVDVKICMAPSVEADMGNPQKLALEGDTRNLEGLWHSTWSVKSSLRDCNVADNEYNPNPLSVNGPTLCTPSTYRFKPHQSDISRPVLSFEMLESNFRNSIPWHSSKTLRKQNETSLIHDSNNDADEEEDSEDDHGVDQIDDSISTLNIFRSGGPEMGYAMAEEAHSAILAAQHLEETTKLESKTAMSCWNAPNGRGDRSQTMHRRRKSKRSGLLLSLCPCAISDN